MSQTTYGFAPVYLQSDIKEETIINDEISLIYDNELINILKEEQKFCFHFRASYPVIHELNYVFKIEKNDSLSNNFDLINQSLRLIKNKGFSGCMFLSLASDFTSWNEITAKYWKIQEIQALKNDELVVSRQEQSLVTELNTKDINEFKDILTNLKGVKDNEKFQLIINEYMIATSGIHITLKNKFIAFITILEMLFTKDKENRNTGKIIEARLNHFFGDNNWDFYKKIYDLRSKLVHTGKCDYNDDELLEKTLELAEIVRKSINLYINDAEKFNNLPEVKIIYEVKQ